MRRRPGAVVSVRFSGHEFEAICQQAEARGMKVTEYIRALALASTHTPPLRRYQYTDTQSRVAVVWRE